MSRRYQESVLGLFEWSDEVCSESNKEMIK